MTGTRWRAAILSTLLITAPFTNAPAIGQQEAAAQASVDGIPNHEVLDYAIEWRLVPAGTAKLTWTTMPRPATVANEVRLHMQSAGLVSRLFRVDDDYTAALGENLCAQNSFLAAHEGSRNRETRVSYNSQTKKADYVEKDLNKNSTTVHEVDIPSCVHDVIGGLVVLRTLHLEPGNAVEIPISDGKKFVQVKVESQRREELNTAMGPRQTIRYEVFLFDNVLYKRSGHLHVWLTDDNLRLPVQLQVRLQFAIGTITLKLEKEEKG
ncbi:MAG: DUF3108 domain-containing protein [Bryobacteraceae bacterium]|jgi:hypothetical protein